MVTRVSGTKVVVRNGSATLPSAGPANNIISAPSGSVIADSSLTVVTNKLQVSSTASTQTFIVQYTATNNVGNPLNIAYNPLDTFGTLEQRLAGGVYIPGGLGVEKDLNVGGYIYGRVSQATTSLQILVTSTNIDSKFYPMFSPVSTGTALIYADDTGENGGLTYNPFYGKLVVDRMHVASTDSSTSTITGAFTVSGGVGVLGAVNIGEYLTVDGDILPATTSTLTPTHRIGNTTTQWAEAYLENIYTKFISSTEGNIQINPEGKLTEVVGDIRVLGNKPIGTAPVVTNVLYVTVDGNDTNDGRAQDSSRACRTVGGAINSPYYQPGTQILVSPGHYLEDNPLRLKPYTSIRGSDIRTTFVEPINKTQDLFHVDSGCYLNYMTFLNGRSGLLEGPYAEGFNRGAYATAFPPLDGDQRIDLFHSPYIQNCTNLSGPWLKDGTMFTPNQTVQVPLAVGTGTWNANTTSIIVNASTGTISQGMYINAGQQNPGFFNARTLMLANKPFMQEQVVAFINQEIVANVANPSSIWYEFVYSQEKCRRDVGILIENVAYDAAFGGNQKSVESGLAYYNGVVSLIAGQELQTTSAINYLNSLTQQVIVNTVCPDLLSGSGDYSQEINTVLTDGDIASDSINSLFSTITNIIVNGPSVVPPEYTSTGPDAAFVSAEILMQANRKFIQEDTINWINNTFLSFPYSEIKCRRDTGLIIDSIALDLKYPTDYHSQSTFAGLQYWNQNALTPTIIDEITTTTQAVTYLKEIAGKVIRNITPDKDLIPRYSASTQTVSLEAATDEELAILNERFDEIIEILEGNRLGWTDRITPNGDVSDLLGIQNAYNLMQANTEYMKDEITAYIDFITSSTGFTYNPTTCRRDIGYMVNAVGFDILHSGNRQSVQTGLYYYGFSNASAIHNQNTQTIAAFNYLSTLTTAIIQNIPVTPLQNNVLQTFTTSTATVTEANQLAVSINTITNIISAGTGTAATNQGILFTTTISTNTLSAYDNLYINKQFLVEEVIAYIDKTYNPYSFNYDEAKCYRDVGLIVDAVSQDILLGGNQKSVEAGLAYWSSGYNAVTGQVTTTTLAINHAAMLATATIANILVTPQTGTITTQIVNPFFDYGYEYGPQEAVKRNFKIITDIIEKGPLYAPPIYAGGGLFALTGLNGADVKISPRVSSVTTITTGTYLIGLNTSTIGFGINSTLYFGDTHVFPLQDNEVEEISAGYPWYSTSTWNQRKVDPIGSMGGSLVDGAVISARSPIQSFVYDAFTQLTQGGRGVHIKNDGYAQLVSVFTIFCSVGVTAESGGIASIVNSNANFGDICLLSKGYGRRKFTGHVYNPVLKAYPESPNIVGSEYLDQYYPNGFWPNQTRIRVFLPDLDNRPHISLIMEVEPPKGYINVQSLPGFLNAAPNKAVLSTGSIVITDIDTDGIAIGNSLYIRDQENNYTYADTGTVVTDIGYRSITLSKALIGGGQDPTNTTVVNDNWFDLYFCGNAYYTVLSSEVSSLPEYNRQNQVIPAGINVLSTASTGWIYDQIEPHAETLRYLNTLTNAVISNTDLSDPRQYRDLLVAGGGQAQTFINQRFGEIVSILTATNLTTAESIIPDRLRIKTGTVPLGAGSAITLIQRNIEFLAEKVSEYTSSTFFPSWGALSVETKDYILEKCQRDAKIILQRVIYDVETGGRYNSVMAGLSYWRRTGSYHIVTLGETVRNPALFPDGATVNFYQRSYMSASGYVFEYVGAGTNYGALPQVGQADPVQGKETVQLDGGKVFFTSTDQNGDFRIGPGLVISQATGVLSGRTFTKSLFANMTPFILAIEGGGL